METRVIKTARVNRDCQRRESLYRQPCHSKLLHHLDAEVFNHVMLRFESAHGGESEKQTLRIPMVREPWKRRSTPTST